MDGNARGKQCDVCGARVGELRRGRCWGCYLRWSDARPVGLGASCALCGERRRDHLRLMELLDRSRAMCHNCAVRAMRLTPMPNSLEGIRERLERDRRHEERRAGKRDHRIFARERRDGERRSRRLDEGDSPALDAGALAREREHIIEILEEDLIEIEIDLDDLPLSEQLGLTRIHARPETPD
jgi:hypothetical protein